MERTELLDLIRKFGDKCEECGYLYDVGPEVNKAQAEAKELFKQIEEEL